MVKEMISRHEIELLVQRQEGPAVSIYTPVSRIGDKQDAIRYKNILVQAEKQLIGAGMRPTEARSMLEEDFALVQDPDYWMHLGTDGLAVFRSGSTSLRYHLPMSFRELVVVGKRFHIKPLFPLLASEQYLVLALSKNSVRLFRGDRHTINEIELPEGTPASMAEALQYDDPERQLQYHTGAGSAAGRRPAVFHGQGVGIDEKKETLTRYFQMVDKSLFPMLEDEEFPIMLAGTEELHAVYQRITSSQTILPGGITGNVKDLPVEEFHRQAWQIASEYYYEGEKVVMRDFHDNLAGKLAVDNVNSVLTAAFDGRVDTLFVAEDEEIWGEFDQNTRQVVVSDREGELAEDLLDQAVVWTFRKKGKIYVKKREDMPVDSPICALLRF
jgi:hypothetical protein